MPSCANSTGGASPGGYSDSKGHRAPLRSDVHHSASRTFTTNQPSVTGARPEPKSSSRASCTGRVYASKQATPGTAVTARLPWVRVALEKGAAMSLTNAPRVRWLALMLTLATLGLAACGGNGDSGSRAATTSGVHRKSSGARSEQIVIKAQANLQGVEDVGDVLQGSSLG